MFFSDYHVVVYYVKKKNYRRMAAAFLRLISLRAAVLLKNISLDCGNCRKGNNYKYV